MSARAFTLIELLIAVVAGAVLLGIAAAMMLQTYRTVDVQQRLLAFHEEAAACHRLVDGAASSCHAGGAWICRVTDGADDTAGNADDGLEITFLTSLASEGESSGDFRPSYRNELVWFRLAWSPTWLSTGRPALLIARSAPERSAQSTAGGRTVSIIQVPQSRRDARRDLDDNDLRFLPGLTPARWASIGMLGDGADLTASLSPVHSQQTVVSDVSIGWLDADGSTVEATARGITRTTRDGAVPPADVRSDARRELVDGSYLDGRDDAAVPEDRSLAGRRPVLLRLAFTMADTGSAATAAARGAAQRFAFTFPIGRIQP